MAEAVVSFVVDRLGDLLIQQASSLTGVKDEVEDLRHELIWIQSFLEDADLRQDEGSVVRTWVSEIRDAAYNIEDIIDTYILKVIDEDENPTPGRRQCLGSLMRYACICLQGANLYAIGKDVEEVKSRIRQIGQAMQSYGIKDGCSRGGDITRPTPQERFLQLRRSSPHDDGTLKDTIMLDKKVEELIAKLENEEDRCRFITITGMGGIGKTTLATKVYNCEKVKHHFKRRAWAYVSKDFNVKDVLKRLIKEVKPNPSAEELQVMELLSEEDLEEKLRELLKDYTYLVVLDDIWDLEAWESLKRALPHNKGGRIILTSRNTRIAEHSFIYQLRPLNETDSWKLFVAKAFGNDGCPTNLEASGQEMVKKCDGLPLAITVLAGLLKGKSPQEWFIVGDHIDDLLMKAEGKNNVEKILSFSYNDLPHQLKPCYLYIGLFPEDFEIIADQLIPLWVAEGFIRCERDYITMENVAEDYLNELIHKNMLLVARRDKLGKVNSCRIHDLLRDICISKGQKEHFIDYSPRAAKSSSSSTMVTTYTSRRYAIHSGIGRYDFFNLSSDSHLRTLMLFSPDRASLQPQQLEFISNMRLLRVLDLSHVDLKGMRLPNAFGKLIHLRYLGLNYAKLPSSIGSLRSLLNLQIEFTSCHWSDIGIDDLSKLTQLRHLRLPSIYWNGLDREVDFRFRIDTLTNLQSLSPVDAIVWEQNEMTNLINLQHLKISNMQASSDMELVLSSIAKLDRIQSLSLNLEKDDRYPENPEFAFATLLPLSHCRHLQVLTVIGKIERLPKDPYHEFPPRLTELQLWYSRLGLEAMAILGKLPHLMSLYLWAESIRGKKIVYSAQGFPQLRHLLIFGLETEEWEIKEGALPMLNELFLLHCINLKKIPTGLRFVASIQMLHLDGMSEEFWDRFDRREDAHEIRHIPSRSIYVAGRRR